MNKPFVSDLALSWGRTWPQTGALWQRISMFFSFFFNIIFKTSSFKLCFLLMIFE